MAELATCSLTLSPNVGPLGFSSTSSPSPSACSTLLWARPQTVLCRHRCAVFRNHELVCFFRHWADTLSSGLSLLSTSGLLQHQSWMEMQSLQSLFAIEKSRKHRT